MESSGSRFSGFIFSQITPSAREFNGLEGMKAAIAVLVCLKTIAVHASPFRAGHYRAGPFVEILDGGALVF